MVLVSKNLKLVIWGSKNWLLILKYMHLKYISRQNNVFTKHAGHPLVGYLLEPFVVNQRGNCTKGCFFSAEFHKIQFETLVDLKIYDSCVYLPNTHAQWVL